MRIMNRSLKLIIGVSAMTAGWSIAAADAVPAGADRVNSVWQHHELRFDYMSVTTLYTCSGLESKVQSILGALGARPGAKVRAGGCLGRDNTPAREAWVRMEFDTLMPPTDASQPEAINASWTPLLIESHRPSFMADGDCELIDAMKDVITKNFSLRGVDYVTHCIPHGQTLDSYSIKGEVLRAAKPAAAARN
jgi:hypothetical protein